MVKFHQGALCKCVDDSKLKAQNKKIERLLKGGAGIFALQNSRKRETLEREALQTSQPLNMRGNGSYIAIYKSFGHKYQSRNIWSCMGHSWR